MNQRIERALEREAGISVIVEDDGETVILSGLVETQGERQTAIDLASEVAPDCRIVDNLEVLEVLPERVDGLSVSEVDLPESPGATPDTWDTEALEPGDFTDQRIAQDPFTADGPSGTAVDEEINEGEESYVPPIDPVRSPDGEFLGGFSVSAMDEEPVARSAEDGEYGNEAIADAVRRELSEYAATTALEIEVDVMNGIVTLRGRVSNIEDAENAEEVASRLPGVAEVREQLEVVNL